MQTSYFARASKLEGHRLVSISRGTPEWFKGERLIELAPSWELVELAKAGNFKEYLTRYEEEVLSKQSALYIYRCYANAIFMCHEAAPPVWATRSMYYEKPYFCHRHRVSDWFKECGLECKEVRF